MTDSTPAAQRGDAHGPAVPQHPDVALWRTATRDDIDAIHGVLVAADAVDHPTWLTPREDVADTFDLSYVDHGRDTLLAFAADGTAIAFGSAFLHPSREGTIVVNLHGAVRPEWRRRGIGRGMLAWQEARAREQVADEVGDGSAVGDVELKLYADEIDRGRIAIAQARGFAIERWFMTMVRDMGDAVSQPPAPDGVEVVGYAADRDVEALAARNDAFRDHWGSLPFDEERWDKFVRGEFFRPDLSRLVLDADGRIAAFCLVSVNEDDWAAMGASHAYIDLIGVVRAHRRRGLAPLVVSSALEAVGAAGLEKAVLDVDTESPTGANSLYERLGFAATERQVALVKHL